MFYSCLIFAVISLVFSSILFAQTAPHTQPPRRRIKNLYILDIGKPTILSIVDTNDTVHKLFIPLNKGELTCKALAKITKRYHLLMKKASIVYIADNRKIHTFTPCKKSQGVTH